MKRFTCLLCAFLCTGIYAKSPIAWINEIHYDNAGTDQNEFVEVVVIDPENYYLGDLALYMYNGYDGKCYCLDTVDEFDLCGRFDQYQFYVWYHHGIQNDTEGMQLVFKDTTLDILAYEGSFIGATDPGTGLEFPDICVCEPSSSTPTNSIYLSGTQGSEWIYGTATPGQINPGQSFSESSSPIELNYFKIKTIDDAFHLIWETANENECLGFTIYKNRRNISFIEGIGSSSNPQLYQLIDNSLNIEGENEFILSQISYSGEEIYLDTIIMNFINSPKNILGRPFPNPFNPYSVIPIILDKAETIDMCLYDLSGQKIKCLFQGRLGKGEYNIELKGHDLASGKYILECNYSDQRETKIVTLVK